MVDGFMGIRYIRRSGKEAMDNRGSAICLHAFSDISHLSPAAFLFLLKECYVSGTRTATQKFKALQQTVYQALHNKPNPGPATFILHCLYIVPLLGGPYGEGFSHLLTLSLHRVISKSSESLIDDFPRAKRLAAKLFLDILSHSLIHSERILIKISEHFDIGLKDIAELISGPYSENDALDVAKSYIEQHVADLMESESYLTAVTLSERFCVKLSSNFTLLLKMMDSGQYKPAEKWATLMGKQAVCIVVQKYLDLKMLKSAYEMIKMNDLQMEFPGVRHLYKESVLKKLAEKRCWDPAELRAQNDRQLLKYLVKEICERYSLEGFDDISVSDEFPRHSHFLDLSNFVLDEIVWVDEINGLLASTKYLESCKVIGIDCEWKPNYEKCSQTNKVSIMQVASENGVVIFDLTKLYQDEPKALNHCFSHILCSSNVLKSHRDSNNMQQVQDQQERGIVDGLLKKKVQAIELGEERSCKGDNSKH